MKKVLVLAEVRDGQLRNVSLEALTAAQALAEGGEIVAGVFGADAATHAVTLGQHGASTVYTADHTALAQYTPDAYVQALTQLIELASPDAVVLGHTAIGRDIAPRVAARLGYGLVSDVTSVEAGPVFVRPIYAGKATQTRKFVDGTTFITIRPNNIAIGAADPSKTAVVVPVELDIKDLRTIVKDVVRKTSGKVDLSEAKVVISGGRGVKSAEGFQPLYDLAEVLGAAVGASRGACDADYCEIGRAHV